MRSKYEIGFSACFPYGADDGPCVFDDQCKDNLLCGYKNCPASFNDEDNCCTKNELLKSPNFPIHYPPNTEKTWNITIPVGSVITLQFHSFHVRLIQSFISLMVLVESKNRTKYRFINHYFYRHNHL